VCSDRGLADEGRGQSRERKKRFLASASDHLQASTFPAFMSGKGLCTTVHPQVVSSSHFNPCHYTSGCCVPHVNSYASRSTQCKTDSSRTMTGSRSCARAPTQDVASATCSTLTSS